MSWIAYSILVGTPSLWPEDYLPAVEAAFKADRTTVLDVIVDPEAYPPITGFESRGA